MQGCLLLLEVLQEAEDIRVGHVEAGLADVVLDVHVGIVLAQDLASLSLSPMRGCVQRSPTIEVLKIENVIFCFTTVSSPPQFVVIKLSAKRTARAADLKHLIALPEGNKLVFYSIQRAPSNLINTPIEMILL